MDPDAAFIELQKLRGMDLLQIALSRNVTVYKQHPDGRKVLNKGWAGHAVERYLGLPLNASRSPNLGSWELKVVPMVRKSCGTLVPKETMAITMLDPYEVLEKEFYDSYLYTKIRKLILVSRLVENNCDRSPVLNCHKFNFETSHHKFQIIADYNEIRTTIRQGTRLSSKMGRLIQARTKGQKGSESRAFYARKELVSHMAENESRVIVEGGRAICAVHAGQENQVERRPLDGLMESLPENQSGSGRHKCPYCAYNQGFRDGVQSIRLQSGNQF